MKGCLEVSGELAGRSSAKRLGGFEIKLHMEKRSAAPAGSPDGTKENVVFVEGVVEMTAQLPNIEAAQVRDPSRGVRCPRARENRQDA